VVTREQIVKAFYKLVPVIGRELVSIVWVKESYAKREEFENEIENAEKEEAGQLVV
jgi:hypothetical protein